MATGTKWLSTWVNDDESYEDLRNCFAGTLTGALYKSSGGLRKSAMGGLFGLALASLWSFGLRKNETVSYYV